MYDVTAGEVMTPHGPAKFVSYDPTRKVITVEHDYTFLTEYDGRECYVDCSRV